MTLPTFRFVAWSDGRPTVDAQFWRDVDASDRLASRSAANRFLRELCRSKAWEGVGDADQDDTPARLLHESALLHEVMARGYRLSGPDLDAIAGPSRRGVGDSHDEIGTAAWSATASRSQPRDEDRTVKAARA